MSYAVNIPIIIVCRQYYASTVACLLLKTKFYPCEILMKKTIKFKNSVRITLFIGAISATSLSADTYYYHQSDGSILLTDKKVNKKGYTLKKTYRSKRKSKPLKHKTIFVKKNNKKHAPNKRKSCKQLSANVIRQKTHPYLPQIQKYALQYQVEENLIRAIMRQESCFKVKAKSPVGAMGLMQLMPGTAKDLGVVNAWNPEQNIRGGVKYISQQLQRFKGDKRLALAAYNAGPGAVLKYRGIPPYRETQHYVRSIMSEYQRLKKYRYTKKLVSSSKRAQLSSDFSIFWGRK